MRIVVLNKKKLAGLSLIETMIAVTVSAVLMGVVMAVGSYGSKSFAAISNYIELDRASRKTLDRLTLMVREADGITAFSTNSVNLSYNMAPLVYTYNPTSKTLTENFNGKTTTLLSGCEAFRFDIFQRNTLGGSYDQYPAALDETEAKILQVSWICSRRLLGKLINTESIQSAKIVIRK